MSNSCLCPEAPQTHFSTLLARRLSPVQHRRASVKKRRIENTTVCGERDIIDIACLWASTTKDRQRCTPANAGHETYVKEDSFGDNTENKHISQKIEKSCTPPAKQHKNGHQKHEDRPSRCPARVSTHTDKNGDVQLRNVLVTVVREESLTLDIATKQPWRSATSCNDSPLD